MFGVLAKLMPNLIFKVHLEEKTMLALCYADLKPVCPKDFLYPYLK